MTRQFSPYLVGLGVAWLVFATASAAGAPCLPPTAIDSSSRMSLLLMTGCEKGKAGFVVAGDDLHRPHPTMARRHTSFDVCCGSLLRVNGSSDATEQSDYIKPTEALVPALSPVIVVRQGRRIAWREIF